MLKKINTKQMKRVWTVRCQTRSGKQWEKHFAMEIQARGYAQEMSRKYRAQTLMVPFGFNGKPENAPEEYCRLYMEAQEKENTACSCGPDFELCC